MNCRCKLIVSIGRNAQRLSLNAMIILVDQFMQLRHETCTCAYEHVYSHKAE